MPPARRHTKRDTMKQADLYSFEKICIALELLADPKVRGRVLAAVSILYGVENEILDLLGDKS